MIIFETALIDALRAVPQLVSLTQFNLTSRISIALYDPDQPILRPGLFVHVDSVPLEGADSSVLHEADVTFYAVSEITDRKKCAQIQDAVESQFRNTTTKTEKKFDISNNSVYCIGTQWRTRRGPRKIPDLDCYEGPIIASFQWGIR